MFRVVYVSSASVPFDTQALTQLLEKARAANAAAGVTGMLVYCRGEFLQALEGPPAAVRETFARIERDPRHHDLFQLQRGDAGRLFGNWAMGFSNIDGPVVPGVVQVNNRLNLRGLDAMDALDFLTASSASQK